MKNRLITQANRLLFLGMILLLAGCSSQDSRGSFDTLLCWLRPSCLPSDSASTRSFPPRRVSAPRSQTIQAPPPCHTTVKTTITDKKPSITISYIEPTTQTDGTPLTNLAKTSIYRNYGNGFIKTKDIPATNAKGGGRISEIVSFAVGPGEKIDTTICVTATNSLGQEG